MEKAYICGNSIASSKAGSRVEFCPKQQRKQRQNIDRKRLLYIKIASKATQGSKIAMTKNTNVLNVELLYSAIPRLQKLQAKCSIAA